MATVKRARVSDDVSARGHLLRERAHGPIAMRRGSEEAGDGARACGRFVFFRMTAVLGARLARGGVG